jgi:hypothetical protein
MLDQVYENNFKEDFQQREVNFAGGFDGMMACRTMIL